MAKPARRNFVIYQGTTLRDTLRWAVNDEARTPVDLTGCTARMQIRPEVNSPIALMSLTTEDGGITLGGPTGDIDIFMSAENTALIAWEDGVWDLEVVHPGGDVTRVVQGRVMISPEVTRG